MLYLRPISPDLTQLPNSNYVQTHAWQAHGKKKEKPDFLSHQSNANQCHQADTNLVFADAQVTPCFVTECWPGSETLGAEGPVPEPVKREMCLAGLQDTEWTWLHARP